MLLWLKGLSRVKTPRKRSAPPTATRLFSKSIVTCQLPLEPRARGAVTPAAFAVPSAPKKLSRLVAADEADAALLLTHSALPRCTLTGTDHTSVPELTIVFRSWGMTLSQPSDAQTLVIGSIFEALTQVLTSSWPAWTWKLSGGLPPCMRVASTAFALLPAPPATAWFTMVTLGYFALKILSLVAVVPALPPHAARNSAKVPPRARTPAAVPTRWTNSRRVQLAFIPFLRGSDSVHTSKMSLLLPSSRAVAGRECAGSKSYSTSPKPHSNPARGR